MNFANLIITLSRLFIFCFQIINNPARLEVKSICQAATMLLALVLFISDPSQCVHSCAIVCAQGLAILTINYSLEFYKEVIHGT